jgi:hypothetical protein
MSRQWWFTASARCPQAGAGGEEADTADGPPGQRDAPAPSTPGTPEAGAGLLPSISLPKGGGAIRGIDEKLSVSQPTGTASLTVGVFTSPARQGFGPELVLGYDSGAGNGPFGLGWSLGVPAITRKTSKGLPRYQDASDSDVFILSDAEDLVPLLAVEDQVPPPADTADPWPPADTEGPWTPAVSTRTIGTSTYLVKGYRPRVEAGFARIERWQNTESGDVHWRTISRQNVTSLYGQGHGSRIVDPDDPTRNFTWLLDLSFDDRGNAPPPRSRPRIACSASSTSSRASGTGS